MNWWDCFRMARRALQSNRIRSSLTMLGIIIGVASVIAMASIGSGAQTQIDEQIRSLGANVLMVEPGAEQDGGVRSASGTRPTLTDADATAIAELPGVQAASPSARGSAQIVHGNRNWNTSINGTTTDMFVIREWPLAQGRYFTPGEEAGGGRVALIGRKVAEELFGEDDPVGEEIRILNAPFTVVGVLAEKGMSGSGRNQDDDVFVPLTTARLRLVGGAHPVNRGAVTFILVKAESDEAIPAAVENIKALLRQRHRLTAGMVDDFTVTNPAEVMALQNASTRTFSWLLAAVASVSLIVGGISIMNIMLVSVNERTREIGLRLALGARRRDVRSQFLIEAIVLCLIGGAIGIITGAGAAVVVARLAEWPIFIGLDSALVALGFSAGVGIFFGWYPALKAARLDPVLALRSE